MGVEFKCSDAPAITKSMHVAFQDLKLDRLLVVYPGGASYPIHPKATAMPLADALREIGAERDEGKGKTKRVDLRKRRRVAHPLIFSPNLCS